MPRYFNRASSLTGIRELARAAGADLKPALLSVDLSDDLLRKPDERIGFDRVCALFEHCATAWSMPDFGLRLARYQHLEILGPVALITRMERSLRGVIEAITKNLVIHTNALRVVLEEKGNLAALVFDAPEVPSGHRQYMLATLAVARNLIEQAAEARIDFVEVSFRHQAGGLATKTEAHFGCSVIWEAERNALYFDRAELDRQIERSDIAYHALINRFLTMARQEVAGRTSDAARIEIARQMELGICTLENVARTLGIQPRSLQRRLSQEGIAFRDLVDDWRRARALSLVTRTRLPMSEVSLAVGFADQSIFTRAFSRWYGKTPHAYRMNDAFGPT